MTRPLLGQILALGVHLPLGEPAQLLLVTQLIPYVPVAVTVARPRPLDHTLPLGLLKKMIF